MGRVGAGNHRLGRDAARVHTSAAKLVTFDDGDAPACVRKSRSQGRACLARPDDDCVEVPRHRYSFKPKLTDRLTSGQPHLNFSTGTRHDGVSDPLQRSGLKLQFSFCLSI